MKIKKLILENFKRFDKLTIDLGDDPKKIIALVGPNGCGKSSVFDAFESKLREFKGTSMGDMPTHYYSKLFFASDAAKRTDTYNKNNSIQIIEKDNLPFGKKSFCIRSPYR